MKYLSFKIENYRGIKGPLTISMSNQIIPLVGINECGKTTILQAIFAFDYYNDDEYQGRQLKDLENLYETTRKKPPTVTANIKCDEREIRLIVEENIKYFEKSTSEQTLTDDKNNDSEDILNHLKNVLAKEKFVDTITLSRNLETKEYNVYFGELVFNKEINDELAKTLIQKLPYILYNDDFNDRPPDKIPITIGSSKILNGWEAIYDNVFSSTNSNYSLSATVQEKNANTRSSIISDVNLFLHECFSKEWTKLTNLKKHKVKIHLSMDIEKNMLQIQLIEEINGKERFFNITDRSKGFLWYYNFIMKVRFNPKHADSSVRTVFLLDEPGSYLHATAQEKLCGSLKNISSKEDMIVYCTHSAKLLNPEIIPINNIIIVEKHSKKYIQAKPLSIYNETNSTRTTTLQPILEALQVPEFEIIKDDKKILLVEGIYDKLAINIFSELNNDIIIMPGTSASSIINNISYCIGYGKKYIAIWDNDPEGIARLGDAKKHFGTYEAEYFGLLPSDSNERKKRRMEEMFSNSDLQLIKANAKLPYNAKYETILSTLYYDYSAKQRSNIISGISEDTKQNFMILTKIIHSLFSKYNNPQYTKDRL